jgi:opacity protein-like surface antigen
MVVTKGVEVEVLDDNVGYTSLRYLEIPILLRRDIPVGDSAALFVVAGPGLGVLLSAKNVENDGGTEDIKDETKDLDIGLIVGGGVGVPLSSGGALEIEVRYEHGMVSVDEGDDVELENRAVFALGGYRF